MFNYETLSHGANCYDQAIWSMLQYLDAPGCVPMAYSNAWSFGFDFDAHDIPICQRMTVYTERDLFPEVLGIRRSEHTFGSADELIAFVREKLANDIPVAGYVDPFYTPWNGAFYQKKHANHCISFIGIIGDTLYCCDRMAGNNLKELPLSIICDKMFMRIIVLQCVACLHGLNRNECYKLLLSHLKKHLSERIDLRISRFADYLLEHLDFRAELSGYDNPYTSPFVMKLYSIGHARDKYWRALEYVKIQHRDYGLDEHIDKITSIARKWNDLHNALNKRLTRGNLDNVAPDLVPGLLDIAAAEFEAAASLHDYLAQYFERQSQKPPEWKVSDNYVAVDISEHFNNRAFASDFANIQGANYNNNGVFWIVRDELADHTLPCGIRLNILNFAQKYDNFVCDNQRVEVPCERYSELLLVVSAQGGAQKTPVQLYYNDGTSETTELAVSDWRKEAVFGERVVYSTPCFSMGENGINHQLGDALLYLQKITINSDKVLRQIEFLPHAKINVFALGLYKNETQN